MTERTFLYEVSARFKCPACGQRVKKGKLQAHYDHDVDRVCITTVPKHCRCGQGLLKGGGAAGNQKPIEKLTYGMRAKMIELGLLDGAFNN